MDSESHTIVRALCERIRRLEDTNLRYKTQINELNAIIAALDDDARHCVVELTEDSKSDASGSDRPKLTIEPAPEPPAPVPPPKPRKQTRKAGRPPKEGVSEAERERKRKWYAKKKAAATATENASNESS
jgi:hypothetical protein